jgi:hypothetical protein
MQNTALKLVPQSPKIDLKATLRGAQKAETTPKSKTPILPVSFEIKELAKEVREAKEAADSAQTLFEIKAQELLMAVTDMRRDLCRQEYQSSVKIPTSDNLAVLVVWSGNYKKIAGSKEGELISIVGDKYESYFKTKFAIKVKDLEETELGDLIDIIGADKFAHYFEVDEVIRPTENFVRDAVLMEMGTTNALEAAGVAQFKPSIRTR